MMVMQMCVREREGGKGGETDKKWMSESADCQMLHNPWK